MLPLYISMSAKNENLEKKDVSLNEHEEDVSSHDECNELPKSQPPPPPLPHKESFRATPSPRRKGLPPPPVAREMHLINKTQPAPPKKPVAHTAPRGGLISQSKDMSSILFFFTFFFFFSAGNSWFLFFFFL